MTVTTPTPFIAKLLAPAAAPLDAKSARAYQRELRYELQDAWSLVYHRYHAAQAHRSYCSHALSAARLVHRRLNLPEDDAHRRSYQTVFDAVDDLMLVPAPNIGALRLKQKLSGVDGGREAWVAAIAADEERLSAMKKRMQ
ncbi:MAG: hypothetical protein VYB32_08070 [Pseudomonadota bacterium]|nr:hypothetical protein [Pseudomonadota bacterium]